jgi:hypothetical protein
MIHIVFETANIDTLQNAIALDESLQGNIWEIKDNYSIGPILNIYETEGYQLRKEWWNKLLVHTSNEEYTNINDDKLTVHQLTKLLDENEEEIVWIWMGQNQQDVCGYYWLMTQLKAYQGRVHILYLNNLPFINEKGQIFYPQHLYEIQPKEFKKAKKLAREITLSEFEVDPDEWKKLCTENAMVRILEGGKKIVSKEEHFYDKEILAAINNNAQKLNKVLQHIAAKQKIQLPDVFVFSRLQALAAAMKIEIVGDSAKGWKELAVKNYGSKSDQPQEEITAS